MNGSGHCLTRMLPARVYFVNRSISVRPWAGGLLSCFFVRLKVVVSSPRPRGDQGRSSFVPRADKLEQHGCFRLVLADIGQIIKD